MILEPVSYKNVALEQLKPHPRNACIYGDDEDLDALVDLISRSGWVKPLVITATNTIISGHRRCQASIKLGFETVPCVVREFPHQVAELEALLLENASRFKTIEQKVREAQAWKDVETEKSRARQLSKLKQNSSTPVTPDLASREKGETREKVAKLVGLKRTTYEKAAKVVRAIDTEINQGNVEHAIALRKILNEQSVDAALQVLKQPGEERYQILSLIGTSKAKNPKEARALLQQSQNAAQNPGSHYTNPGSDQPQNSCWTCQHRLEVIDNHCIYCNKFGILNLIDKSGSERGQECSEWKDRCSPLSPLEQPTFVLKLFLPVEWQNRLEEAAASFGVDPSVWVTNLIGTSLFPPDNFDKCSDAQAKEPGGT